MYFRLSQDAVANGSTQVSTALVFFILDGTGSIPAGKQIWANDELQPSGTTYTIAVVASGGGLVWGSENISLSGTSPISINTAVPGVQSITFANAVLQNPASTQAITGQSLTLTSSAPLVVQSTVSETNSGVFTNTQMNDYISSVVNSASMLAEFQAEQGTNTATEAVAGAMVVPSGATVFQANGVSGYVQANSTTTNTVGVYGQARANANSVKIWGGNLLADDKNKTGVTMSGLEIDANVSNTGTTGACVQANGSFTGNLTSFPAFQASAPVQGGKWSHSYLTSTGSSVIGLLLNPQNIGASQPSQELQLSGDLGATKIRATSGGDTQVQVPSGKNFSVNQASYLVGHGVAEFGTNGFSADALNTAITHNFNISDSGSVAVNIGIDDGGPAAFVQARAIAGTSTAYPIRLNPLGGRIVINQSTDNGVDALQVNGSVNATSLKVNGVPVAGGFTNVNVTPVTVNANTTNDQNLMSAIVPAGTFNSVGKTLMVQCAFLYSTPVASTATINIKVKLGSLTLSSITSSANPGTVTNNSINLLLWVTTQTAGTSAAFEAHGNMVIDLGASPGLADSTFSDTNIATIGTLDSTAQQTLQITVAFSAASGSNVCTQRQMILDSVN